MKELKPLTAEDIMNTPPSWCARGMCDECSRKQIKDTVSDIPEVADVDTIYWMTLMIC